MSSIPESDDRFTVTDAIAGLMAAGSILLSFIAAGFGLILEVDPRPARLAPVAVVASERGAVTVPFAQKVQSKIGTSDLRHNPSAPALLCTFLI